MRKMSTLFIVNYVGKERTIENTVRLENKWVIDEQASVTPYIKIDGTSCAIINGELYKRYDAKRGKPAPVGSIPCQDAPDDITGHFPHWVKVDANNPADRWHIEAFKDNLTEGTYELIGEKIGTNAEQVTGHELIKHDSPILQITDLQYNEHTAFYVIRDWLKNHNVEGIVFHHVDGRKCKIRKTDFGFSR